MLAGGRPRRPREASGYVSDCRTCFPSGSKTAQDARDSRDICRAAPLAQDASKMRPRPPRAPPRNCSKAASTAQSIEKCAVDAREREREVCPQRSNAMTSLGSLGQAIQETVSSASSIEYVASQLGINKSSFVPAYPGTNR